MKTFGICPKCKNPMMHEAIKNTDLAGNIKECWRISCDKTLTHEIMMLTVHGKDDQVGSAYVAVKMAPDKRSRLYAEWDFRDEKLTITEGWLGASFFAPNTVVPYFEPDFTQYDKLIKKLRTYLTFS